MHKGGTFTYLTEHLNNVLSCGARKDDCWRLCFGQQ